MSFNPLRFVDAVPKANRCDAIGLSLVLVAGKQAARLKALLERLAPQIAGRPARELLLVTSGPLDSGTLSVLADLTGKAVVIEVPDDTNRAQAFNLAAAKATHPYLVFTQEESEPDEDWLDRWGEEILRHPGVVAFGGYSHSKATPRSRFARFLSSHGFFPQTRFLMDQTIVSLPNANMALARTSLLAHGGFDETLGQYGAEILGYCADVQARDSEIRDCKFLSLSLPADTDLAALCRRFYDLGRAAGWLERCRGGDAPSLWASIKAARAQARAQRGRGLRRKESLPIRLLHDAWCLAAWLAEAKGRRTAWDLDRPDIKPRAEVPGRASVTGPQSAEPSPGARQDIAPQATSHVRLSLVVPTFKRPDNLANFLKSIQEQVKGRQDREVIVINDGSHSATYDALMTRHSDWVRYIPLADNRGPGTARNLGAVHARGRYLVFTDDDCQAPEDWLDWLDAMIDDNPGTVVFGGTTQPPPEEKQNLIGRYTMDFELVPRPIFDRKGLAILPTANVAIQREWFLAAGGFDRRFFYATSEDIHLMYELRLRAAPFMVDLAWRTYHKANESLTGFTKRWFRYGYGNAQHSSFSGTDTDFGLCVDTTLAYIISCVPAYFWTDMMWYHRFRLFRGDPRWLRPFYGLAFGALGILRWGAYRFGGWVAVRDLKRTGQTIYFRRHMSGMQLFKIYPRTYLDETLPPRSERQQARQRLADLSVGQEFVTGG